ncbi:aminotransferase-like domain-containing protein [Glaciimonas immobilis]|uniref:DNA-binding transcriptional MocR family regulator n=1 Tax=Glaciimonas immobilis TaxID=728004 RepID=A0A840RXP2_9BURK|nr:PLP-dependent aminotransferase family protein [Glaciimonas immobilis]KAF3998578.1 PLP-dependent aminotransferase family protein [Glaciimonas immobilis]MBB5201434.1 DNA-binding transcriptional MocR family regulator [Glaciimonas immobilis]
MKRAQAKPILLSLERASATGLVEQIVAGLAHLIAQGTLRSGEQLPSVRRFGTDQGVGTSTVVEAYERLVARGLVAARRGAGFFIAYQSPQSPPTPVFNPPAPVIDSAWLLSEMFADERVPIKAGCGWLPGKWLDDDGLHQAERRIIRAPGAQQVGYGHPYGYAPLRLTISQFLAQWSLEVPIDQILTTHGATQALDLIIRTMVKRGDTVLIDDPSYCNLIAMLRLADVNVIGIPRTPTGIDTNALENLARLHKPVLYFTTSVLHNPTGTSYTPACAMRVLQAAERHGFWVVEDDIFRELGQPNDPMLAALDGLQRVIYVGSFSKTVAPSLRLGFIACQRELARQLVHTKMVLTLTNSEITERLVHSALTEGHHRRHVENLAAALLHAQARVNARLLEAGLTPFATPRGGMFSWAKFDRTELSARDIADLARRDGIWLAPGDFFHLTPPDQPWFRFNVAYSDVPELVAFFRGL